MTFALRIERAPRFQTVASTRHSSPVQEFDNGERGLDAREPSVATVGVGCRTNGWMGDPGNVARMAAIRKAIRAEARRAQEKGP